MALGALLSVEVGLRLWVSEPPTSLISPLAFQRHDQPISTQGNRADTVIFGGPNIVARKVPKGKRIFFFGGSATEGYHVTPFSCFAGWTQRILRHLMSDGVEVINLGAGGEASRQVAELVQATARTQSADLFIVYSGNNEYYELRALKQSLPGFDARTELARRRLSGLHLYRHLRGLLLPSSVSLKPGQRLQPIDTISAEIDQSERELGVLLYGEHIENMIRSSKASGIPLLLSTVADQARSFAFHGEPPPLSQGVAELVSNLDSAGRTRNATDAATALESLRPKLKTQADYFAVARLLDRDQRWEQAAWYYAQAEYLDPRPRRSSMPMRQMLKDVAGQNSTPVCDIQAELAAQSRGGITGEDVFMDPCHPNPLGHRRIAELFVRCIAREGLIAGFDATNSEISEVMAALPLEGEDPFRLDHFTDRRAQLHENRGMTVSEIEQTIRRFDDGTAEGAAIAGHHATLFKLHRGALAWYDLALERGGERGSLQVSRGLTLQRLHDYENSLAALSEAASIFPEDKEIAQFVHVLGPESLP